MSARRNVERIAFLGKGGIGKSTLSANISALYARQGRRVLHVGCDPKRDSTALLLEPSRVRPVLSQEGDSLAVAAARDFVVRSRLGMDCIEAGGPQPGIGCAGRAIGKTIDVLEAQGLVARGGYDVVLFDILGDVVCGGFAAPLRRGFAQKVVIVVSEEMMSLYAANNIAWAVRNHAENGVALCGLLANLRDPGADLEPVERFARRIGTTVLGVLRRDPAFREGELLGRCLVETHPRGKSLAALDRVARRLLALDPASCPLPAPMGDEEFHETSRARFRGPRRPAPAAAPAAPPPSQEPAPAAARLPAAPLEGKDLIPSLEPAEGEPRVPPYTRWMMWNWGVKDQWREFFADAELALHSGKPLMRNVAYVIHKELECFFVEARSDDGAASFFSHAWPRHCSVTLPLPMELRALGCRQVITEIRDSEIVLGGNRKLEAALDRLARDSGDLSLVVFLHSCPSVITGDNLAPVIERFRRKTGLPVIFPDRNADQHTDVLAAVFDWALRGRRAARRRRSAPSVNLVGFPRDRALEELTGILRETGIEVNASLLPEFDVESVRRYPRAGLQVLKPHSAYETFYAERLDRLGIPALRPESPYGIAGTRRWLGEIARFFGLEARLEKVWQRRWALRRGAWEELRAQARGRSLGFVCDAARLRKLRESRWSAGIPLGPTIREMGFGLEWLLWCGGKDCRSHGAPGRRFHGPEELGARLRESPARAFYSDLACDTRLSRAGQAQFSLAFFEPGLDGALRSLERLLGACRLPFFRELRRSLG
ncbi:MAG: AAA family ATPase [Elusimicrobia bacterium]|nr:AAA family ATPase [Elusimicrobiota bacterium]